MPDEPPCDGEFTGWVACQFTAASGQAACDGAGHAGAAWVRSKAKAKLSVSVPSRTLSLVVSGVDLLGECTALAYTWVPSSTTGNSACLLLEAAAASPSGMPQDAAAASKMPQVVRLAYRFDSAAAGDQCCALLQSLTAQPHRQPPSQHGDDVGLATTAADAVQQVPPDHDRVLAKQAIQRYLLDEEFQAYVAKLEDVWDELEAEAACKQYELEAEAALQTM